MHEYKLFCKGEDTARVNISVPGWESSQLSVIVKWV